MVRPKKKLGQHFLTDKRTAARIIDAITFRPESFVLEIGPGKGVLTQHILAHEYSKFVAVELDGEAVRYLKENFPAISDDFIEGDFLKLDIPSLCTYPTIIVGNFPYNISSQILFKALENRDLVVQLVGMFQREVAQRICSSPGGKTYGILSVLVQAWYDVNYLFTINEGAFFPPPKVKSGVIQMNRKTNATLPCNEKLFVQVVKRSFNQRRKMISNSLKEMMNGKELVGSIWQKRPEQLPVEDFIQLTNFLDSENNPSDDR